MNKNILRSGAAVVGAGVAALLIAGPASAHVSVNPDSVPGGGYTKLTFRVPTESDTASTTKVEVVLPTDHPLASVAVKPHPGWTAKITTKKLAKPVTTDDGQVTEAVSDIVWTADSAATAIKPGQFDEFDISAGKLPDSGSLTFKALQTYSDGSVVRWIEESKKGAPEPEHPAPTITLTAADDAAAPAAAPAKKSDASDDGSSSAPLVLSIIALVAALGALALSLVRRRS